MWSIIGDGSLPWEGVCGLPIEGCLAWRGEECGVLCVVGGDIINKPRLVMSPFPPTHPHRKSGKPSRGGTTHNCSAWYRYRYLVCQIFTAKKHEVFSASSADAERIHTRGSSPPRLLGAARHESRREARGASRLVHRRLGVAHWRLGVADRGRIDLVALDSATEWILEKFDSNQFQRQEWVACRP